MQSGLILSLLMAVGGTAGAQPVSTSSPWAYAATGEMGKAGIVIARVGDHREIITNARYPLFSSWYALRYAPARNDYDMVFFSDPLPASVLWMGAAEVSGDRDRDLMVGLENGDVRLHDPETKRLVASFPTIPDPKGMTAADLDGDDVAEILVGSLAGDLHVFSGSGAPLWQVPGASGSSLAVGQMDDDPGLEIACSDGQIVDVAAHTVQWDRPEGFGHRVVSGDIDGDGRDELVAAELGYAVRVFDVELETEKFTIPTSRDITEVALADTDCDGVLEIVVGDGQGGGIHSFEVATQALKWETGGSDGSAFFSIGDADGDGEDELVWASGDGTSAQDWLTVFQLGTLAIEWNGPDLRGPFLGPAIGDVDGDGEPEAVVASSLTNEGYTGGRILVFDARTMKLRAMSDYLDTLGTSWVQDLKLRNLDGDPALEILVARPEIYDGVAEAFDFDAVTNTFSVNWRNTVAAYGSPFNSIEAADVDLDGQLEIVAGGSRIHSGTPGLYVYVYDYATGTLEWNSEHLGDTWLPIRDLVVETAGGGNPEILAIAEGGPLFVFDGVTKQAATPIPGSFSALRPNPFAAGRSVFLGDTDGNVYRYDRQATVYVPGATYPLGIGRIDGILPLSATSALVGANGKISRYNDFSSAPAWTSADYGPLFGRYITRGVGAHGRFLSGGPFSVEEIAPGGSLTEVTPSSISAAGGDTVTATGSRFLSGAEVFVGDSAATGVQLLDTTTVQATAPASTPGSLAAVLVLNPDASFQSLESVLFVDFLDVEASHPFHDSVETMFRRAVSAGCGAGNYCPSSPLTRAQASILLVRSIYPKGFLAPKATGSVFADVPCGSFGAGETELLASLGITSGCGGGLFCPANPLTRAQTAVFLLRGLEGADYVPPPALGVFADVPAEDPFASWIEELAARGITAGCGGGNYCPSAATTRGQMAVFLSRTFFGP